jgi:hypothetical protein
MMALMQIGNAKKTVSGAILRAEKNGAKSGSA